MSSTVADVRAGCEWQRELCRKNGAPTYVALIDELMRRLDRDDPVTQLLTQDGQDPIRSALCLRLFGAVNRVAMSRSAAWLAAYYPVFGGETDTERVVPEFFDFLCGELDAVRQEMAVAVQTNEVGRAAPLSAAMNHVALATSLPLRLLEVGASAGLNLLLDRYFVDGGGRSWGPEASALRLAGHFTSGTPAAATLTVAQRRGCDLNPIDVHDPLAADVLRSFVWPEHVGRARRLQAALDVARELPPLPIDACEASEWVAQHADLVPGHTTVIFHSIVMAYLDPAARERFVSRVRALGEEAAADRPLAWISLEPSDRDSGVIHLVCETWPTHRRTLLATTTPHGTDVRWEPQDQPV